MSDEPGAPPPGSPPPASPESPPPGSAASGWSLPPPPGAPYTGAGRRRHRRRWPWVLGGALFAIVLLGASGIVLFVQRVKPPIDAANEFLEDLDDGAIASAHRQLCAEDRDRVSVDGLERLFQGLDLDDVDVDPFVNIHGDGDTATVEFDVGDDFDDVTTFELPLRKEGGEWRVCLSDDTEIPLDNFDELDELE